MCSLAVLTMLGGCSGRGEDESKEIPKNKIVYQGVVNGQKIVYAEDVHYNKMSVFYPIYGNIMRVEGGRSYLFEDWVGETFVVDSRRSNPRLFLGSDDLERITLEDREVRKIYTKSYSLDENDPTKYIIEVVDRASGKGIVRETYNPGDEVLDVFRKSDEMYNEKRSKIKRELGR